MEKYQEVLDILYRARLHISFNLCEFIFFTYQRTSIKKWIFIISTNLYQEMDFSSILFVDNNSVDKNTEGGMILKHQFAIYVGLHTLNSLTTITLKSEWDFVNSLKFDEQLEYKEAYFTKMNYISMLKKYEHVTKIQEARSELENKFRLSNNADILLSHVDELYTQCRFKECLEVTTKLLELDMYSQACLPILIVCLHELHEKNNLFLFAHELVEHSPDKAIMWFSVARHLSTMDSHCRPAWVGFGHTIAIESEHDQTITAYSTAAKLYPGSHLLTLFIGMPNQLIPLRMHLRQLSELDIAEYYSKN
ncbi:ApcC hetero-tetramer Cut9-Hcn1 [Gigaspora margarita]|uniref:ApcC hetero-tetramer Cut9-Hcn1 n=1 Tax=Gigaspora margarita TaxID=4874 RepID=A0A8H4AHL1_GIGMA|nr:ApcC hetero-tetramer Cut9-Hcn1 [Gigaspora margarita]